MPTFGPLNGTGAMSALIELAIVCTREWKSCRFPTLLRTVAAMSVLCCSDALELNPAEGDGVLNAERSSPRRR